MITVAEAINDILKSYPLIEQYLDEGLLNYSAFARKIKPLVEKKAHKPVTESSILMALRRLDLQQQSKQLYPEVKRHVSDLILRSNLTEITYKNSDYLPSKQKELFDKIEDYPETFLNMTTGTFETTIIASNELVPLVNTIFESEVKIVTIPGIASITLKLSGNSTEIAGIFYAVTKQLAWNNISITEIVSTYAELTMFFKNTYIDDAFVVLKNFIDR